MKGTNMKGVAARAALAVGVMGAGLAMPSTAHAQMQTLAFGTPGGFSCSGTTLNQPIPSADERFGGFVFSGFRFTQSGNFFAGTANCVATNGSSSPSTLSSISSSEQFIFNSTTFRRSINGPNVDVALTGFLGDNIVFQELVIAASNDFVLFTPASMQSIDRLQFASSGGVSFLGPQFQIDDFAFTKVPNQNIVPEPSTVALLALTPIVLLGWSRRRREHALKSS